MKEVIKTLSEEFDLSIEETELIVSTLLRKPRFKLYFDGKISSNAIALLKMQLTQLKKGVPVEYITKKVQFLDYDLRIFPGVFIPRLETEYFVELIGKLIDFVPQRICEIGTGSGAIAIGLAAIFPRSKIVATDICPLALKNASENIFLHNLAKKIQLIRADLFSSFSNHIFDLIVCNPPYIPTERINFLPRGVRDFEPRMAIDGGFGGTKFIKILIEQASKYSVKQKCNIALEIDEDEEVELDSYLRDKFAHYSFLKDLFGRVRYLFIGDFRNSGE